MLFAGDVMLGRDVAPVCGRRPHLGLRRRALGDERRRPHGREPRVPADHAVASRLEPRRAGGGSGGGRPARGRGVRRDVAWRTTMRGMRGRSRSRTAPPPSAATGSSRWAGSRSNRWSSPATASVWPSSRSISRRRDRLRASLDGTGTRPASRCGRHGVGPTSSPSRSTGASRCRASRTPRSELTRGCSPAGASTWCGATDPTRCSRSGSSIRISDGRTTVVATSLGNLLFDGVGRGALLEVAGAPGGVDAFRIGIVAYAGGHVTFRRWVLPDGASVQIDGAPWNRA